MTVTFLAVTITIDEPFAVRTGDIDGARLAVDRSGAIEVPATGLIGSLRAHLGNDARSLLGELGDDDHTTPSALRALGTVTRGPDGAPITSGAIATVERTAIDRRRGAAAVRTLRDTDEAPANSTVVLFAEYPGSIDSATLDTIASWRPVIGSGRTVGKGSARVSDLRWGTVDPTTPDGLATLLGDGGPTLVETVAVNAVTLPATPRSGTRRFEYDASIVDGLFIGGGGLADEKNVSTPYTSRDGAPRIEGSSVKGAIRSRVAFIATSVANASGRTPDEARTVGDRIAATMFGDTEHRGAITARSSPITHVAQTRRMHVGIDRFTGGAVDGLLFGEDVLVAGTFRILLDVEDGLPAPAIDLLTAALRDIGDGFAGFGGRTARGYGTVRLTARAGSPDLAGALPLPETTVGWILSAADPALEAAT